jgi:hypothetical protein
MQMFTCTQRRYKFVGLNALTYEEIIAAYTRKESEFGNQVSR